MKPAPRHAQFPVGRYCSICGKGQSQRLGGLQGATPILAAAGYELQPGVMYYAHVRCCFRIANRRTVVNSS